MREAVADWTLSPVIEAVQAMRGIDMVGAITFLAELGDLSRFESPRQLMAYLGLTPSERSTGESVNRGGITKAGNTRGRTPKSQAKKHANKGSHRPSAQHNRW